MGSTEDLHWVCCGCPSLSTIGALLVVPFVHGSMFLDMSANFSVQDTLTDVRRLLVGDSRAVLCRSGQAHPLTVDHKPEREDEMVSAPAFVLFHCWSCVQAA